MIIKFLENRKIELYGVSAFLVLCLLLIKDLMHPSLPAISIIVFMLYYTTKIFVSFRHWKLSKSVSFINAYLNFQIAYSILAIGYTVLKLPGYLEITYGSLNMPQYFLIVIMIIFALRWKKRDTYWKYLKYNILKATTGIVLCLLLFYLFDMSSYLRDMDVQYLEGPIGIID